MSDVLATPPAPGSVITISDLAKPLAEGRSWIKFLAIVQLVFAGLYVLISFGFGLLVMWLPIWLSIVLLQSVGAIERAYLQGDADALKLSLAKLKLYFVIQAIAMIVGFLLVVAGIVIAISLGLSMSRFHGFPH